MDPRIASIADRIRSLEDELEAVVAARRDDLRFTIRRRKVRFEAEARRRHRALKRRRSGYVFGARPLTLLTAPVVYAVLLPQHAIRVRDTHGRHASFADCGDAEAYREELVELREALREAEGLERPT